MNEMKVLIVGSGAREDVLRREHEKSLEVDEIIAVPGNGMMEFSKEKPVKRYKNVKATDVPSVIEIAQNEKVDSVDVGPEGPLALGLIDELFKVGIPAFGPKLSATFIEADKAEARKFMERHGIPQPQYKEFRDEESGLSYVRGFQSDAFPIYIKASGLCEGKGALRANELQEAEEMIRRMKNFGDAGKKYLIEECMMGEEVSIFAFCDGKKYRLIRKAVQDNKRVFNYDAGDQTGGMGGHAPALVATDKDIDVFDAIASGIVEGMLEEGTPYTGVLYIGGMITADGPKVVEVNKRHGDPEAQVILPGLIIKSRHIGRTESYTGLIYACTKGELNLYSIETDGKVRVCVVGTSRGYPGNYDAVKKKRIFGIEDAMKVPGVTIFGAGVEFNDGKLYVNGGRVLSVVGEGKDVIEARAKAHEAISMIHIEGNNLHYRTDIAWRDVERLRHNSDYK
jgi:phosphoribosylamine--glycine ligase